MSKKQVASWIVTTVLIAGTGAALAGTGDPGTDAGSDTTVTTAVDASTTTSSVVEDTTTTTVDENTTTTTVDESTTTTTEAPDANGDVADGSETDGGGNSAAARNHDCDEAWGNHGAWVSANAHAMKSGAEVSCDGPSTSTTVAATTDTTADGGATARATATESTTSHGNGRGNGKGHGKNK
jgi:hypothetical protein